jgi:hypothetical protein
MEFGILVSKDQDGNNVARLTDPQRKKAEKLIASELKAQIGIKETPPKERPLQQWEVKEGKENRDNRRIYDLANDIVSGEEEVDKLNSQGLVKNARRDGQDIIFEDAKGERVIIEYNPDQDVMAEQIASYLKKSGGKEAYAAGKKGSVTRDDEVKVGEYKERDVSENVNSKGEPLTAASTAVLVDANDVDSGYRYPGMLGINPTEQQESIIAMVNNGSFGYWSNKALSKTDPEQKIDPKQYAETDVRRLIHKNILDNRNKPVLDEDKDIIVEGRGKDAKVKIRMKNKEGKVMIYTYPLNKLFLQNIQKRYTINLKEVQGKERGEEEGTSR